MDLLQCEYPQKAAMIHKVLPMYRNCDTYVWVWVATVMLTCFSKQLASSSFFFFLIIATFAYLCVCIIRLFCTGVVLVNYLATWNMLRISPEFHEQPLHDNEQSTDSLTMTTATRRGTKPNSENYPDITGSVVGAHSE